MTKAESTIWDVSEEASTSFFDAFKGLYSHWFWPLFLISFLTWIIVKDDKAKAIAKKTTICICVFYVLLLLQSLVTGTLGSIAGWFGGDAS